MPALVAIIKARPEGQEGSRWDARRNLVVAQVMRRWTHIDAWMDG